MWYFSTTMLHHAVPKSESEFFNGRTKKFPRSNISKGSNRDFRIFSDSLFSLNTTPNKLKFKRYITTYLYNILLQGDRVDDTFGQCKTYFKTKIKHSRQHLRGLSNPSGRENVMCLHAFHLSLVSRTSFGASASQPLHSASASASQPLHSASALLLAALLAFACSFLVRLRHGLHHRASYSTSVLCVRLWRRD